MNEKECPPLLFEDVIGHHYAKRLLQAALNTQHIAPAYLFTGTNGVGRKLTALRFLEGLNNNNTCNSNIRRKLENRNHPDLLWVEPTYLNQGKLIYKSIAEKENLSTRSSPQIRLEQIKEVKRFLGNKPLESNFSMILIEAVEMLNESAANALLKILEEPTHGIFLLITARPECILSTIKSRCQIIPFNRLSSNSIEDIFYKKYSTIKQNNSMLINQIELLNLSDGSPGQMINNIQAWENIPEKLWPQIKRIPFEDPLDALSLAKEITDELTNEQQIWLINWIQQHLWIKELDIKNIKKLDKLRLQIEAFVQPRLSWEITLLTMMH
tara:strand:+ start:1082 stop:2059 length:978 start_codon:yes stop_codon:yes gene_type:complete